MGSKAVGTEGVVIHGPFYVAVGDGQEILSASTSPIAVAMEAVRIAGEGDPRDADPNVLNSVMELLDKVPTDAQEILNVRKLVQDRLIGSEDGRSEEE